MTVGQDAAGAQQARTGVEVDYAIAGDVTAADYHGASTGTLTIANGQSDATITITTIADDVLDPRETLTLSLTDAMSLPDDQGRDQGLAVVDPTAGADSTEVVDGGSVRWSVEDITVPEGDPAVFMVTMDGAVQDDVTLTYHTEAGTATEGADYTGVPTGRGRVTVSGNSRSASFTVATLEDRAPESTETFTVRLTLAVGAPDGVAPENGAATASITDDDLALVPVPE